MEDQQPTGYRAGDKVRIRSGPLSGRRGIIEGELNGELEVELDTGETIVVPARTVTNYSAATRAAWQNMPKKAGRKPAERPKKKMVSIRLEEDIWRRLGQAVEAGLIRSREEALNTWIREQLDNLIPSE